MVNFMRMGITALVWFLSTYSSTGQDLDLPIAKAFAENYEPAAQFARLNDIPSEVVMAFKRLGKCDQRASEKYLSIILIKLYRAHLLCCNQSYELRTNLRPQAGIDSIADPLIFEFNSIARIFDPHEPIEFISSAIPYIWIKKRAHLRNEPIISKELGIIKNREEAIRSGKF